MRINAGLDTGDMLLKWETPIGPEETAVDISPRLAENGARLLIETLQKIETIEPIPQNDSDATFAPILKKDDGQIDFSVEAATIVNRIRGFQPWPGAFTQLRGQRFHIWKALVASFHVKPGQVHLDHRRLWVGCGGGTALELLEVQMEGRKRMPVSVFLNGFTLLENEQLG